MNAAEMMDLAKRLYPIHRSLTGPGVRETLSILSECVDLAIHEVPSGTRILDWTVPKEWRISEAWVRDPDGNTVIDLSDHTLHVVGYSVPVHGTFTLDELRPHLHSLPDQPTAIPYRTSYYTEEWGFCLAHEVLESLGDGEYEVLIDSELIDGSMTYGEVFLPGDTDGEVLLSSHICHPSTADDNVSGMVVTAEMANRLAEADQRRLGVRILFAPATIGTIAWLARTSGSASHIAAGLTLVCLGDAAPFTYKRTVFGDRVIDRAAALVLGSDDANQFVDFTPFGYDERQHNTPGYRSPVGSLARGQHGRFPEYHTSLDDLDFISGDQLVDAADTVERIVDVIQRNRTFRNLAPYGEPQLGRRGLYERGAMDATPREMSYAMLWVLNLSDGQHDLIAIAARSGLDFETISRAAAVLELHELLEDVGS